MVQRSLKSQVLGRGGEDWSWVVNMKFKKHLYYYTMSWSTLIIGVYF